MRFAVDTHTHSLISGHAFSTIRELAKAASDRGLEALAVTEHGPMMPGSAGEIYFINYFKAPKKLYGVRMLYGAELNILDRYGNVDLPKPVCEEFCDVIIASVHVNCFTGEATEEALTDAYTAAMEKPYIHIIGHPDDGRFPVDYDALVKAAKRTHTMIELNCASLTPRITRTRTRENMIKIMRCCEKYGVYVTVGSDAHADCDVGDFTPVDKLITECNFPEELIASADLGKFLKLIKEKKMRR